MSTSALFTHVLPAELGVFLQVPFFAEATILSAALTASRQEVVLACVAPPASQRVTRSFKLARAGYRIEEDEAVRCVFFAALEPDTLGIQAYFLIEKVRRSEQ